MHCRVVLALAVALTGSPLAHGPAAAAQPPLDVNSLGFQASYEVEATFNRANGTVSVHTTAQVTDDKPWPASVLAFNLATLRTGHARITSATVDGAQVTATPDDQTVLIPMDPPLTTGQTRTVTVDYDARLNADPDPDSDDWGFAGTRDFVTGYRWIPWLSRTTPFNRPSVGDPYVTASSPHVRVEITGDPSLLFGTTGVETSSAGGTHVFEAHDVRDFNFAASASYHEATRTVRGINLRLLYRELDAQSVLDITARAVNEYSDRIGAYPYPQLTITEVGPWAPLESPTLFWLPSNAPARLLPWMTAHETGHQWFYSVVGNDQAREPFADEAITDFISRSLISRFVPSQCAPDFLDYSIYDLGPCYPWVVYVQGDAWLRDYQQAVGGPTFYRGLADYYAHYRNGLGGTRQVLDALDRAAGIFEVHHRFPRLYAVPDPHAVWIP